jgi:pimeloyl-ACP methyl ester carboxylesterase
MHKGGNEMEWKREDRTFVSEGVRCAAWLYLPEGEEKPPVIVMAHGFGGVRSFRLPAFAERFVEAGMAVFLFDYRTFGDSEGEPRNLIDPFRHLEDWRAAVRSVRELEEVDGSRVGVWGSSFSGGHVLMLAAEDHEIQAVSAQVPYVDPITSILRIGIRNLYKAVLYAKIDFVRGLLGMSPLYIPMVGEPGTVAALATADVLPGYRRLVPEGVQWDNRCPARILVTMTFYRPMGHADAIQAPTLIIAGTKDSLIDPKAVRKTAERIPNAELVELPVGHFDPYFDETFEVVVTKQREFFVQHLLEKGA